MDDHIWSVDSAVNHKGTCPTCNPKVDLDELDDEYARMHEEVDFASLNHIGDSGASNLQEKGIITRKDVSDASDEEILDTSWVGEKGLHSLRNEVQS
jgi:predicted flap endonuclease-1-like 5' DNA nuclease